jgi:hypothetical protein
MNFKTTSNGKWVMRTAWKPVKVRPVWAKVYISRVGIYYNKDETPTICRKCSVRTDRI